MRAAYRGTWAAQDAEIVMGNYIEKYMNDNKLTEITVLNLGSTHTDELNHLPDVIKNKINFIGFDNNPIAGNVPKSKYKSYKFIVGDIFKFDFSNLDAKADLVINRAFLHHCTTEQKNKVFEFCDAVLNDNGRVINIDWFIGDWETEKERCDAIRKYAELHCKLRPGHPTPELMIADSLRLEVPDFRGGKMDSVKHTIDMIKNLKMNIELSEPVCNNPTVSDPKLFGQYVIIATK